MWTWDQAKNRANLRKHGISFELAQLVFDDPLAVSRTDPTASEERWQTIGMIGQVAVFVVHTWPEGGSGRIISARKATRHEKEIYQNEEFD